MYEYGITKATVLGSCWVVSRVRVMMVMNDIFILCDFSFSGPDPSVGEHKGVWGCRGSFGGRSRVSKSFFVFQTAT